MDRKLKRILKAAAVFAEGLLIVVSVLLICSVQWMFRTWSNLNMEELVYQLKSPIQGTSTDIIWDYVNSCGTTAILVLLAIIAVICGRKKIRKFSLWFGVMTVFSVCGLFGMLVYAWNRLDIGEYADNQSTYSTFIDDHYVNPRMVDISFPEQKRNLIYIFLESMETTFADEANGGAFEENIIPELTQLSLENESFAGESEEVNGGYSLTGTTWTAGAMIGQTSGLPLNLPIGNDDMYTQTEFFPTVTTIGDILASEGYVQDLLMGSYALFSGKDIYFRSHGGYNIYDYAYSVNNGEIPEDYYVWWGYEDTKLFEFAQKRLTELSAQPQPFSLTMITADTHFEDGYLCEDCREIWPDDRYANVYACSSRKVAAFVDWIKQQPFYENTTIVITGDHLTMDSDFCEDVDSGYPRKVYTTIINAPVSPELNTKREYSTFDNFPTTIAALGAEIEGNRLGLGTNLFSDVPTLTETYGVEKEDKEIARKSRLMEEVTSSIDVEKAEKKKEEEQKKTEPVQFDIGEYDPEIGGFSVDVSNINVTQDVQKLVAAVYMDGSEEGYWYESQDNGDGSYSFTVWAADAARQPVQYRIELYAIDSAGVSYFAGQAETGEGEAE